MEELILEVTTAVWIEVFQQIAAQSQQYRIDSQQPFSHACYWIPSL